MVLGILAHGMAREGLGGSESWRLEGSARAVVTALGANVGIVIAKFVAAATTGSTSMLAEGVHSSPTRATRCRCSIIGGKRARQAPSTLHQFGYARARYIYAFLVAVVLFTLGGLYALYEGYHKITDPHPLTSPLVAVAVLFIAMALEGYVLRNAVREANHTRGTRNWLQFVRRTRSPELPVILLEDSGALIGLTLALLGVGLSVLTGNGVYDGIASLCIGVLLAVIAILLAREITSLLIGEAALPEQVNKIHTALTAPPASNRSSTCAPFTSDPTTCSSPQRSAYPRIPTPRTSLSPSTAPKHASAKRCPLHGFIYLEPDIYRADAAPPPGNPLRPTAQANRRGADRD